MTLLTNMPAYIAGDAGAFSKGGSGFKKKKKKDQHKTQVTALNKSFNTRRPSWLPKRTWWENCFKNLIKLTVIAQTPKSIPWFLHRACYITRSYKTKPKVFHICLKPVNQNINVYLMHGHTTFKDLSKCKTAGNPFMKETYRICFKTLCSYSYGTQACNFL